MTGSDPMTSKVSSTAGCSSCRPRLPATTGGRATGGSCRCAKSRCPAPSCSTLHAGPAASSTRWSRTTWISAGPTRWHSIFDRRVTKRTPGTFSTRVVTRGVDVTINVNYKNSRIKEYLKEGRALRIETVVNDPTDLGCQRRLHNLPELQARARAANTRLLTLQRVGQGCAISTALFERIALPSQEGQRTGALRFGEPRVMALAGALCANVHTVTGFTNRSLRARVAGLLGADYQPTQMSYDLGRLRRKELIDRLPHTNTYVLTPAGIRFALFYTKLHDRVVVPLFAADHPPTQPNIRNALAVIDHTIEHLVTTAHITRAA